MLRVRWSDQRTLRWGDQLSSLWWRAHLHRGTSRKPVPRSVVPNRVRPASELDAGLRPDDGAVHPGRPAGAGGASVYGYVRQSPMMLTDPSGECPWCVGAAAGAAFALLWELMQNDGQWECVDWLNVGVGAAFGAVGGQAASFWKHGATGYSRYGYSQALRSYRNAFGIRGGGTEVHHVFAVNGAKAAGWHNSARWLKPLPKDTHRRLHGSWGGKKHFGLPGQAWHGCPGWAKGVVFPPAAGAAADGLVPCACAN